MGTMLRYFFPIYIAIYIFVIVILRGFIVWRKTKIFPVVIAHGDDTRALVSRGLAVTFLIIISSILIACAWPSFYYYLMPINYLENFLLQTLGMIMLLVSLTLVAYSQAQMGESWRIGIDERSKTKLINQGLYKYSRNPIYVGMILSLLGIFLILPNAISLLTLVVSFVLFQVQIRLEEEYLLKMHGDEFREYLKISKRWL